MLFNPPPPTSRSIGRSLKLFAVSALCLGAAAISFASAARELDTPEPFNATLFAQEFLHKIGLSDISQARWPNVSTSDDASNPVLLARADGYEDDEFFTTPPRNSNDPQYSSTYKPWYADLGVTKGRGKGSGENGNYLVNILIDRYFGKVNSEGKLSAAALKGLGMPKTVPLKLRVYDVDDDYQGSGVDDPEQIDFIKFNGHELRRSDGTRQTLSSGDGKRSVMTFNVPVEWLVFPERPCFGEEGCQPGINRVEIEVDQADPTKGHGWVVAVDWAMLEIKALRPVILLHGYGLLWGKGGSGGDETSYNNITKYLEEKSILHIRAVNNGEEMEIQPASEATDNKERHYAWNANVGWSGGARINTHKEALNTLVERIKTRFGVQKVHIIAHSKGGLDTRAYLRGDADHVRSVQTFIQAGPPNHGNRLVEVYGHFSLNGASNDLASENIRDDFNYVQKKHETVTKDNGKTELGSKFTRRFDVWSETLGDKAGRGFFIAIGDGATDADSTGGGVNHQSAIPPWAVKCTQKIGSLKHHCNGNDTGTAPIYTTCRDCHADTTWPEKEAMLDIKKNLPAWFTILDGAPHSLGEFKDNHYAWMLDRILGTHDFAPRYNPNNWEINGKGGDPGAKAASVVKNVSKDGAQDDIVFGVDLESEELVFSTIPGSKQIAPSFVLQQGVPVKVLVVVDEAPAVTVVLKSPTGVETPLENMANKVKDFTGFVTQYELTPAETGVWSVHMQGAEGKQHGVMVSRARSPSVAMDAWLEKDVVGSGEAGKMLAYLYDPRQANTAPVPLSQTVQYASLAVQALMMQPDGTLETIELHDDGANGDEQAGDGIYTASYTPKVQEGQLSILLYSIRDGHTQLTRSVTQINVTAAAASRLQEVTTKPTAEETKLGVLGDVRFGISANVAKAGEYFIIADIVDKSGAEVRSVYSSRVQVAAPGVQEFIVTLEREYLQQQGAALPLNVKAARLFVSEHDTEDMVNEKEFNEPIPFDDASAFEELRVQFLGVQSKELKDTDGDGQNDQLQVTYRLALPTSGSYTLQASIGGADGEVVEWNHKSISGIGEQDVVLTFDVPRLKATGLTGFYLKDIGISAGPLPGSDPKVYPIVIENGAQVDTEAPRVAVDEAPLVVDMDTLAGHARADLQIRSATGGAAGGTLAFSGAATQSASLAVYNAGGEAAENIAWQARIGDENGTLLTEGTIAAIGAGESVGIMVEGDAQTLQGQRVFVTVNPRHSVTEANYANNIAIFDAVLDADPVDPDIPADSFDIAVPAVEGGTVECSPNPVADGDSSTCTITPADGYFLETLTLSPQGAATLACGAGQAHCSCAGSSCTFTDSSSDAKAQPQSLLKVGRTDDMPAKAQPAQSVVVVAGVSGPLALQPLFRLRAGSAAAVTGAAAVPTLGEWALMLLAALMAGFAFQNRRRWER